MAFARGSEYAQDTWDIVRDAIPKKKRAKLAQQFYTYWCSCEADAWDNTSNLLQDTELPHFQFYNPKVSHMDKVKLAVELFKSKSLVFYDDEGYRGVVKQIYVSLRTERVQINRRNYSFDDINNGLVRFEMEE